jgi:hypothetical protein
MDSEHQTHTGEFQNILSIAEESFKRGLQTFEGLNDKVRGILRENPTSVLGGIALAGFLTGVMVRSGSLHEKTLTGWRGDPILLFLASAAAGLATGARITGTGTAASTGDATPSFSEQHH